MKVPGLEGYEVTELAAGYYHVLALTRDTVVSKVFAWGRNDFGQLALGHKQVVKTPKEVVALDAIDVDHISCGCYHSLFLSDQGEVYSVGRSNHHQLGVDVGTGCAVLPQFVESLKGKRGVLYVYFVF